MRITDFDLYQELLREKSGLSLSSDKSYMLESRLSPIAKKWGFISMEAMTAALQGVPDLELIDDVMEAMTTNDTAFFADSALFDSFKSFVVPKLQENRPPKKGISIWSCASASGQEPYSIAITLQEFQGLKSRILASDLSKDVIEQSREGLYSQFEVQRGLPINLLMTHFTQEDDKWRLKSNIRSMVKHKTFNLLDNMSNLGQFDVIFCCNVLHYFDNKTQTNVLERLLQQLQPDGFLLVGGAEKLPEGFEALRAIEGHKGVFVPEASPYL